ncbi:hypothetical protein EV213_11398 [Aureibacillus halotolerans]|uniref:Uncharacterized protein n=1 Tax=Aureibacillus halotolerans TaxID=1508390 RepID=A0A4R6TYQ4_9BACI|nr:hypothetical protein EV213_11398 [Aureibacillus halotolerans]
MFLKALGRKLILPIDNQKLFSFFNETYVTAGESHIFPDHSSTLLLLVNSTFAPYIWLIRLGRVLKLAKRHLSPPFRPLLRSFSLTYVRYACEKAPCLERKFGNFCSLLSSQTRPRYNWVNLKFIVGVAFYTSCHTLTFTLKGTSASSIRKDLIVFSLLLVI